MPGGKNGISSDSAMSAKSENQPLFQDLVTQGSALAAVTFDQAFFVDAVKETNSRFGLAIAPREEAFKLLEDRLLHVSGRYWQEAYPVDRKSVRARLIELSKCTQTILEILWIVDHQGLADQRDVETVLFLQRVIGFRFGGKTENPRKDYLQPISLLVKHLDDYCMQALLMLEGIPARKGRREGAWYDILVDLMIEVAEVLGIKVSTAGDRSENPYATPFTVLTFAIEKALDKEARSPSLAACAKRIDRSLSRRSGTTK
jgi:hypothetical protein